MPHNFVYNLLNMEAANIINAAHINTDWKLYLNNWKIVMTLHRCKGKWI